MTTPVPPGHHTDDEESSPPQPVFRNVEEFVRERFCPVFTRTLGGEYRWCGQWWLHAEAVSRLTALWRAWETLRLEPALGIADWYQHVDHHLPILMGPRGPFYQCTEDEHIEPHVAKCVPAPRGYWDVFEPDSDDDQDAELPY